MYVSVCCIVWRVSEKGSIMDSLQTLTPKASSEIDTELEEEIQGGMAGPSSLSAQNQRRRFVSHCQVNTKSIIKPRC